tara:strand:- start:278 stop:1075 length:798 start_codon:yes stop_codon:yes gene_type:complete
MDYRKIKGNKHYVFSSTDEYYSHFGEDTEKPVYWKDAVIENKWVIADDKGIVQLLKVGNIKHPNDRKNYSYAKAYVRTIVGTFIVNNSSCMDTDFSQHRNRYTFSKTIGRKKNVTTRKNVTKKEKLFATNVVAGYGPVKAYMDAFQENSKEKAGQKAVVLLKQERVMSEIEKSVLDVAKSLGVDHQFVLNKLKHLSEYSEDDNIILQSTKELGKIIGTSGVTVKQREMGIVGMFQGFSPEQLQDVGRKQITNGEVNVKEDTKDKS